MTPLTIFPIAKTAPGYQPFTQPELYKTIPLSNHRYIHRPKPGILENHPGHAVSALALDIRNPLTNIELAVEMLRTAIKDESLKIYLDIIMRSSIRINSLANELLDSRETEPADKNYLS